MVLAGSAPAKLNSSAQLVWVERGGPDLRAKFGLDNNYEVSRICDTLLGIWAHYALLVSDVSQSDDRNFYNTEYMTGIIKQV
jgi:hypothetical protein